jgi:Rad3-related DNA helicase
MKGLDKVEKWQSKKGDAITRILENAQSRSIKIKQLVNLINSERKNGILEERKRVSQAVQEALQADLKSLREEILDIVGEEVSEENQLENFYRYHTKLSNGKYLEHCDECDNDQKILKVIAILESRMG